MIVSNWMEIDPHEFKLISKAMPNLEYLEMHGLSSENWLETVFFEFRRLKFLSISNYSESNAFVDTTPLNEIEEDDDGHLNENLETFITDEHVCFDSDEFQTLARCFPNLQRLEAHTEDGNPNQIADRLRTSLMNLKRLVINGTHIAA